MHSLAGFSLFASTLPAQRRRKRSFRRRWGLSSSHSTCSYRLRILKGIIPLRPAAAWGATTRCELAWSVPLLFLSTLPAQRRRKRSFRRRWGLSSSHSTCSFGTPKGYGCQLHPYFGMESYTKYMDFHIFSVLLFLPYLRLLL